MTTSTETNFIDAIYQGDLDVIKKLYKEGKIDIISKLSTDFFNRTPIQLSLQSDNFNLVKFFLKRGADVTIVDCEEQNFIDHLFSDKYEVERGLSEIYTNVAEWIQSYNLQKSILKKFPSAYGSFKKYDVLDKKIIKEFAFLDSSIELNLL